MDDRALIEYVKREVMDLLDAGRVGLYEFADILRSRTADIDESSRWVICESALDELRSAHDVRLVWQRWTDLDYCEDASEVALGSDSWRLPESDPFLAVVPSTS